MGHNLNRVNPATQAKYGNVVCRLLFNIMRSMGPDWGQRAPYPPLDESQNTAIDTLRADLDGDDEEKIDTSFHDACYLLFAHERHQHACSANLGRFFSPVNLFLIYSAMLPSGSFRLAGEITTVCAALEYVVRGVMLVEISCRAKVKATSMNR